MTTAELETALLTERAEHAKTQQKLDDAEDANESASKLLADALAALERANRAHAAVKEDLEAVLAALVAASGTMQHAEATLAEGRRALMAALGGK